MTTKKRATTVELIDVPAEYSGAVDTAWKRAKQLSYGMPRFMLEAMKPMIVSIYMQGLVDGYGVRDNEIEASASSEKGEGNG